MSAHSALRWLGRAVATAGSLALLLTFLSGTAQAAYPGSDGRIAFIRAGNVFTIDPSGAPGSLVQLTTNGHDSGPRWSPSGNQIAYVHNGNLWVIGANGGNNTRLTNGAPLFTDSRPSWSPDGNYLAFVQTRRGQSVGDLLRYSFLSQSVQGFTTTVNNQLIAVSALPAPVAWAFALNATGITHGSFIAFEGAAALCQPAASRCLDALGFPTQSDFQNGFPSALDITPSATRLTDPDWFPQNPMFDVSIMTTQEQCGLGGSCVPVGLDLTIGAAPIVPGAYQGVYSPTGLNFAYVLKVAAVPHVFVQSIGPPVDLGRGTQPDWQPL
jgi:hypothetical protein